MVCRASRRQAQRPSFRIPNHTRDAGEPEHELPESFRRTSERTRGHAQGAGGRPVRSMGRVIFLKGCLQGHQIVLHGPSLDACWHLLLIVGK